MKAKFTNLKRFYKQILMILSDQIVILFALTLSFVLRFGDIGESFNYMSKKLVAFCNYTSNYYFLFCKIRTLQGSLEIYRSSVNYYNI